MSDVVRIVNSEVVSEVIDPQQSSALSAPPLPAARHEICIRPGVLSDYPFIDALQKANTRGVGFMFESAVKGHLEKGHVLIAEASPGMVDGGCGMADGEGHRTSSAIEQPTALGSSPTIRNPQSDIRHSSVGYVIGVDRYLKRDELGVIYQMCVVPEYRRSLVAANLLKAQFERSAYGCRLYCCWCAQDLAANRFWEAMGFVPLAFRTGGGRRKKDGPRMHIFWQKRIREGDEGLGNDTSGGGGTPYWFPSQTGGGAIAEDRIVLPIPPGTSWDDAKPTVLPEGPQSGADGEAVKLLESEVSRLEREKKQGKGPKGQMEKARAKPGRKPVPGARRVVAGGLHFGPSPEVVSAKEAEAKRSADEAAAVEQALKEAKKAVRKAKQKFDPAQVAFARELKDRWLEQVQAQPNLLAASAAKYAVRRCIAPAPGPAPGTGIGTGDTASNDLPGVKRLDAA